MEGKLFEIWRNLKVMRIYCSFYSLSDTKNFIPKPSLSSLTENSIRMIPKLCFGLELLIQVPEASLGRVLHLQKLKFF
jgi:hypothetical protein